MQKKRVTKTPCPAAARAFAAAALVSSFALPAAAQNKPYKGGELLTQQQYRYGRIEVRMQVARGSGILSTFFTYKNGSEGAGTFWEEIDIEVFGKDDATSWQTNIITGSGTRQTTEEVHTYKRSLADGYNSYVLEWTPDYVAWKLNGREVRRVEGGQVADLKNPQSLRFNLWAANIVEWVGEFDTSVLPVYQFVNWISYSRYENGQFVHEWTDEFNNLDMSRWSKANWTFAENLVDFDPNNVLVRDGTLILALTHQGQTGFNGTVPVDPGPVDDPPEEEEEGTGGSASGGAPNGSGGAANSDSGGAPTSGGASAGGQPSASGGAPSGLGASGGAPASVGGAVSGPGAGGAESATGGQGTDPGATDAEGCSCHAAPGALGSRGLFASAMLLFALVLRRRARAS